MLSRVTNGIITVILTGLFIKHVERLDQFMRNALDNAHLGLLLVLQVAQRERHRAALGHFGEKGAGRLHLQHVRLVCLLVNRRPSLHFSTLTMEIKHFEISDPFDCTKFSLLCQVRQVRGAF